MPETIATSRGDQRTGELVARNEKEIQFIGDELLDFAAENLIHIFNISPYAQRIEHPLFGCLTIPACPEGKEYSDPSIIRGLVFNGVPVEMKTVEMRHESGRVCAVDLLGIGPFKSKANSLLKWGIFIAAEDTFDLKDVCEVTVARGRNNAPIKMQLPRWVKSGKLGINPTKKELAAANERFSETDFALIAEADQYWNDGPNEQKNITRMHREALTRRGQLREWSKPLQSLIDCPGCGEKIKPTILKHIACGYMVQENRFSDEPAKAKKQN